MQSHTHLVIGVGEIGTAIGIILKCDSHDPAKKIQAREEKYDVIHICFPYSHKFKTLVRSYRERFNPRYVVIHSTVPIGTCEELEAVHSPVRGKHPYLELSVRTFTKYFGGKKYGAETMAEEFEKAGVKCLAFEHSRDTEAGKLYDLMQYGASILVEKEIYKHAKENGINFKIAYEFFNETYNLGYQNMGMGHFTRPILTHKPGPIGGHCVVQMMELLDSPTAKRIIEENKKYGKN